ncbi:hypothetical protein CDL15_Pgr022042 [Punica granatum]|uniref:Uncharacterized protein n=1 Tax=Punica granatum TaxID=22663 RepID=A0A218VRY9_PUNGR|nr:hypothetical protein CDL15_Pgr022042 [Punica granatum]
MVIWLQNISTNEASRSLFSIGGGSGVSCGFREDLGGVERKCDCLSVGVACGEDFVAV